VVHIFEHLLVPVDGSEPSESAVDVAVAIAQQSGGEIIFCSVVNDAGIIAEVSEVPYADPTPAIDALTEAARDSLAAAAARAAAAHVASKTELVEGDPVSQIVRLADEGGADVIVMGSHGRRGLERLFLGSTTEGVLRSCTVPVLVIRK
jgi:nucleotide-binding universal stress UspA family protein